MDALKFRVFDKQEKRWCKNLLISQEAYLFDEVYDEQGDKCLQNLSPDRYEVNRCTGLKDKNGKLIYEGDRLKDGDVSRTIELVLALNIPPDRMEITVNKYGVPFTE